MSRLDRRGFLQSSAAVAAAAAIAQSASGQDAPSERVRVGVMGLNGRGAALAQVFSRLPGSAVAYVCDVDESALEKGLALVRDQQSQPPQAVKDFRKILDDPAVDALAIAAPDHWHGPATILACAANKHVYVEKPACHNPREGELMIAAARKHGRVVQMGNQRRSSPGAAEACQKVRDGIVGRALFARAWISSTRPSIGHGKVAAPPANLDYALWQGPAPEQEYRDNLIHYQWHWFWHWGTGELGNNGVHALDLARWGLGVDCPQRVVCGGGKYHFDDDQQTPDTQLATFDFGDRAIQWEHRTWHRRGFEGDDWGVIFYGEQGTLVLLDDKYVVYDPEGRQVSETAVTVGEGDHQANFLECVRSGGTPNSEIEIGVASTMLCLLGNIAYRTGRTVKLDPASRQLTGGDAEQQALWGREYRSGWEPVV
jgi:predicted dehydrogenase